MEEQRIDPAMEPAIARRPERAGGWWDRNQDFIRRRAEARMQPAAAQPDEAERGTEPAAISSMEDLRIDPAMEPATARRGGDGGSSRPGGWRARNEDFIRRRAATLATRPAAQAAEAECGGREPASKKSMADLTVPAAGEVRELSCAVCLHDLVAGGGGRKLRTMPCSHSFHQRCLFEWLHVNRHCPMCRFAMPSRPDGELVGDDVERELVAEEEDDEEFAASEERSSSDSSE